MRFVVQRVKEASVTVEQEMIGKIGHGLLVFVGVSDTDDKQIADKKIERWQSIAESAAKQSKRNIIPEVGDILTYKQAMAKIADMDLFLVPYENERGMIATKEALDKIKPGMSVGILVGPEGGFDDKEIELAREAGAHIISLGSRILRAETAAVIAVGMGMLHVEMNIGAEE